MSTLSLTCVLVAYLALCGESVARASPKALHTHGKYRHAEQPNVAIRRRRCKSPGCGDGPSSPQVRRAASEVSNPPQPNELKAAYYYYLYNYYPYAAPLGAPVLAPVTLNPAVTPSPARSTASPTPLRTPPQNGNTSSTPPSPSPSPSPPILSPPPPVVFGTVLMHPVGPPSPTASVLAPNAPASQGNVKPTSGVGYNSSAQFFVCVLAGAVFLLASL